MITENRGCEIQKSVKAALFKAEFYKNKTMQIETLAKKLGYDVCAIPQDCEQKMNMLFASRGKNSAPGYCMKVLIQNHEKQIIFYDGALSVNQKNFVLAHEIAHFELGHTQQCSIAEDEANLFAINILGELGVNVENATKTVTKTDNTLLAIAGIFLLGVLIVAGIECVLKNKEEKNENR